MNITSLDVMPPVYGNSMEVLRELVRSVVREELQKQRLDQNAPMISSLADVIREEVRQADTPLARRCREQRHVGRQMDTAEICAAMIRLEARIVDYLRKNAQTKRLCFLVASLPPSPSSLTAVVIACLERAVVVEVMMVATRLCFC
ncbi:hypothetical protein HPB52_025716 [Rhipicephalus sanguineus]|uniref:Uncharacterized protein n=1 Tax=Rhipicephalus sanguineus TaxID=34632 RepID=A0A9D4TCR4_RHISA|nr:hypothetical protein HPB52_025716 [Rhipicephalus sanguineus]